MTNSPESTTPSETPASIGEAAVFQIGRDASPDRREIAAARTGQGKPAGRDRRG